MMRLWLRRLSELQPTPMQGTEVFTIVPPMIWSPDSRFIAYDATRVLKKASVDGGTPQTICQLPGTAVGGSWNARGDILMGNAFGGLVWCHEGGGSAAIVSAVNSAEQEIHLVPSFLSDGHHFIYLRISRNKPETSGVYLGELSPANGTCTGACAYAAAQHVRLSRLGSGPRLFQGRTAGPQSSCLRAMAPSSRSLSTNAVSRSTVSLSASPTTWVVPGHCLLLRIVMRRWSIAGANRDFRLTWFDRNGIELGRVGTPGRFTGLALSPNGERALVSTHAPQGTVNQDLWLFDLSRSAAPQRMTFEPTIERSPLWINDDEFAFGSHGGPSGVYRQSVNAAPHLLFKSGAPEFPSSAGLGGRFLLYTSLQDAPLGADIWMRTDIGPSDHTQTVDREGRRANAGSTLTRPEMAR